MSANGDVHTFYSSTPTAYNNSLCTALQIHTKEFSSTRRNKNKMSISQLLKKPSDGDKEMNPEYQVVTMQPEVNVIITPLDNPPDYMRFSIFSTLCCCLPLGLAALVFSITTQNANLFGHRQIAYKNSKMARKLNHVSLGIGIIIYLLVIGLVIYFGIRVVLACLFFLVLKLLSL
nr:synapse differentiation-inducing gene protein 1-like [Misgurnus anguillicaudatus]